ncbi:MAG: polysaccharide biosynthesis protein [Lachnospiraceae bacterium]|jgi:stage V sporulation protein B|nr:polysaccharide biosynthesis protein [Lachnospiraceae bacterium]
MAKKRKDKNFLVQGSILAFAGVLTKIIGIVYRVPLVNIVGNEGMGYYNVAFFIYIVALTLTSYSLPLAVSKLVSARIATGEYKNAYRVFKGAVVFSIVAGGAVSIVIFVFAKSIASDMMSLELSVYALRVLAPCILVVAVLGVMRGFFQGNGSMVPTAVSQVLEQIVNAAASIIGAIVLLKTGEKIAAEKGSVSYGPAYAAAGGTIGTVLGAVMALAFLLLTFFAYRKLYRKKMKTDKGKPRERYGYIIQILLSTIAPVLLSATVYNISDFVDSAIFNRIMDVQGVPEVEYASMLGILGGQYSTLINVPLSISTALAAAVIPSLVATAKTGNRKQIHRKIQSVTRFNMLIAIPSAVGFIVLARPILDLLFTAEDNAKAALMLQIGAISVIFFCLSTVTNSVLQGLDDMMTPVKNAALSLIIHVVSLFLLLVIFKLNIFAVVASKIIFSVVICILNAHALRERVGYVQEQRRTFLMPILSSLGMAVAAILVRILGGLFMADKVCTVFALLISVLTYLILLLRSGALRENEILDMPKGQSIAALCRKLHLLKE